jgi:hypothetical protein
MSSEDWSRISGFGTGASADVRAVSSGVQQWQQSQSTGLQDIIKQMQDAQNKANAANEKRYQDILASYSNLGKAGMTRIGEQEQQAQAKGTQDLTSRGLGNTTVTGAMSRGVARDAENSRQQLQEQVAQLKGGVMERKTEQGPDMGLYAQLIQAMSRGQTSSGGGPAVIRTTNPVGSGGGTNMTDWMNKFSGRSAGTGGW